MNYFLIDFKGEEKKLTFQYLIAQLDKVQLNEEDVVELKPFRQHNGETRKFKVIEIDGDAVYLKRMK